MGRLSVSARRGWDSLKRGPCWPHPPSACLITGAPSPSDIGIERCLFQPVPHTVMHDCSRGRDGKALRECTARLGLPQAGTLLATPTKCMPYYRCAIIIRHRNRALSFPTSTPYCDAWLLARARWEGSPLVHGAVGTPSSGGHADHTHQLQSLKQVCHHDKTSESSAVFSNQYPTLGCITACEGVMGRLYVGARRGWDSLQRVPC